MDIQQSYTNNKPTLYIVSTPIGNLDDMTFRAVEILKDVDYILCEDTRHSKILLDYYNISNKLIRYENFNENIILPKILKDLENNFKIALISDAGTPGINDPGYMLISSVVKQGYNVVPIPGASAVLSSIVSSGFIIQPFIFLGFLPRKINDMKNMILSYKFNKDTLVIYESPLRVLKTLSTLLEILGNREIVLAKEITKMYETFYRGKINDIINSNIDIKGEFCIIVSGYSNTIKVIDDNLDKHIYFYLNQGYSQKEAIKLVSKDLQKPKREIYEKFKIKE